MNAKDLITTDTVGAVTNVLKTAAKAYQDSKATTNAGIIIRALTKLVPYDILAKMFAHKFSKA